MPTGKLDWKTLEALKKVKSGEHTPWTDLDCASCGRGIEVFDNSVAPICGDCARLIAAAPELLEALHECIERLREVEDLDRKRNILPGCQQRANYVSVVLALEAIRKATGEE